jgi:hypothetical protein
MIVAYLGLLFLFLARYNKDKKKKVELIEKKRVQDKETKKDTSIEDEVAGTYDSKKYLRDTGADKGKDEFAKQLLEAQDKGKTPQTETPAPKQTPAPQPKPAPVPPQPQQRPLTQQPQAQAQPAATQQPPLQQQGQTVQNTPVQAQQPPKPPAIPQVPKPPQQ